MDRRIINRKIDRIAQGKPPRTLDLFAGCGGLSLGFFSAGYNITAAMENDPFAARSHATNLWKGQPQPIIDQHAEPKDIVSNDPAHMTKDLGLGPLEDSFDVIMGGPPCQAYARVGRPKLREVFDHPTAFLNDPRGNLYLRFLAYVEELQPLAILIENVPDVMNIGGHNISNEICEVLEELGYTCGYTLLNAAYYGVPQMRERMFLIGYAIELGVKIAFPKPTHWVDLPVGYEGSRNVAMRNLRINGGQRRNGQTTFIEDDSFFVYPPASCKQLRPAVTATRREAFRQYNTV